MITVGCGSRSMPLSGETPAMSSRDDLSTLKMTRSLIRPAPLGNIREFARIGSRFQDLKGCTIAWHLPAEPDPLKEISDICDPAYNRKPWDRLGVQPFTFDQKSGFWGYVSNTTFLVMRLPQMTHGVTRAVEDENSTTF